jgi:8-oxo-dGTP diphosphatase
MQSDADVQSKAMGCIVGTKKSTTPKQKASGGIIRTARRTSGAERGMTPAPPVTAPRVGVGAVVIKDRTVLLVKRGNPPNEGTWAIPGGLVELGETLQEAAEREIKEETGLTVRAKAPIYTFDFIEKDSTGCLRFHYVIVDLIAEFVGGTVKAADDAADARWFNAEELDEVEVSDNTRKLFKEIRFIE